MLAQLLITAFGQSFKSLHGAFSLFTVHCSLIPPFSGCNPMIQINMVVFLFACGSAFCYKSSANQPQTNPVRRDSSFSDKLKVLSSTAGRSHVNSSSYAAPGRQAQAHRSTQFRARRPDSRPGQDQG